MKDLLILGGIFLAWFVVNKYILPRFGVST